MNGQTQDQGNGRRPSEREPSEKLLARRAGAEYSPAHVHDSENDAIVVLVPKDGSDGDGLLRRLHAKNEVLATRWADAKRRPDGNGARILAQTTGKGPLVVYAGYEPSRMMSGAEAMVRAGAFLASNKIRNASMADPTASGVPGTLAEEALRRMRSEHAVEVTLHRNPA